MAIIINRVQGTELHKHAPGQVVRCNIELDCQTGILSAVARIGNGMPGGADGGHVLQWGIPALKSWVANEMLATIKPLAERILAGYRPGDIAEYSPDAQDACDAISEVVAAIEARSGARLEIRQATDYFAGLTASDFAITADTSDERLADHASVEARTALGADGVDVLVGLLDYLRGLRAQLR